MRLVMEALRQQADDAETSDTLILLRLLIGLRTLPYLFQFLLQVPQSPLEDLSLLVQPLDVLLATQKAMPSAVVWRGFPF
jgi:hypothetical protein